ncbi:MAG: UDP-N-acetylmuramoyl-L-alanyl-D-glutamate--2,6-diaminopimelate ligase [Pseudomonadota bacterium]
MSQSNLQLRCSLRELLSDWIDVSDKDNTFVTGMSEFSGDIESGDLFLAISGNKYCTEAIANGAVAILYEDYYKKEFTDKKYSIPVIAVNKLYEKLNDIVLRFYKQSDSKIKTVAITGTDGKTSVAYLTAQALENTGEACGLIGTLGYGRLSSLKASTHTTPPQSRLAKEYHQLEERGCGVVAVEASSHGLSQNRLQNIDVHTAVLTNITRDHLDYHETVEEYIRAKAKLFFDHYPKCVVINLDDPIGRRWCDELINTCQLITYSIKSTDADIYTRNVEFHPQGMNIAVCILDKEYHVTVPLLGEFNVLNILAVISILISLGKSEIDIIQAINQIHAVPGRMQIIKNDLDISVIVDFAHTPSALLAAINAIRVHCQGNLICVFGCGGDRDKGKRSEMGRVATESADEIIITSDNPRGEDPQVIIDEIIRGCVDHAKFTAILDRRKAISQALNNANKNDAVLIAGKGHETTQLIGNQKYFFNDVEVAREELAKFAHG